ncbi:hypothetical protein OAT50_00975 [Candidatus Pelagibacter sp.]|jgi:hypothetical protein|nr:hypothetical protein [Candidatus Pelagibacter sp.]
MKKFYSCVDSLIPSPLSEQHLIIKQKAEKENGSITAYASEEFRTVKSQPWIFIKLSETPGLHGVVFFTALQFSYGSKFNLKLFNKIINNDYEIHFAREDISFSKENRNFEGLDFLLFNSLTLHRKEKELFELI